LTKADFYGRDSTWASFHVEIDVYEWFAAGVDWGVARGEARLPK
jgi:hypothetical protein